MQAQPSEGSRKVLHEGQGCLDILGYLSTALDGPLSQRPSVPSLQEVGLGTPMELQPLPRNRFVLRLSPSGAPAPPCSLGQEEDSQGPQSQTILSPLCFSASVIISPSRNRTAQIRHFVHANPGT